MPFRRRFVARFAGSWLLAAACAASALTLAACSSEDTATPVATPGLSLSRDRVGLGAPVDFTYQFDVTAPIPADYRVLVHVVKQNFLVLTPMLVLMNTPTLHRLTTAMHRPARL